MLIVGGKMTGATQKSKGRSYAESTIKILFAFSGNQCAWPSCNNPIVASPTSFSTAKVIGQIAHIFAHSNGGPRSKKNLTDKERKSYPNLLLFCPTHHVVVDKQEETYPADLLMLWKENHERKYQESISYEISELGFSELEVAAKALMNSANPDAGSSLQTLPPKEKIAKNGLTHTSELLIKMGAAKSSEVQDVIRNAEQLDSDFPDRLRDGFVSKYMSFYSSGLRGDDLFLAIYDWAAGKNPSRPREAAGLCILSHLFIICDVFKK